MRPTVLVVLLALTSAAFAADPWANIQTDPWAAVSIDPWAGVEAVGRVENDADKWERVGEPIQVAVACPTCPSGFRYVGQTAQLWRWKPTGELAHIVSDDGGALGIWYYGMAGSAPRWAARPKQDPIDKEHFQKYHWRYSLPSCGMQWCISHGGGWILEANRKPEN